MTGDLGMIATTLALAAACFILGALWRDGQYVRQRELEDPPPHVRRVDEPFDYEVDG